MSAAYTIDTNILINLGQRYPRDIFPGLWDSLEQMILDNRICVCRAVFDELHIGGDNPHAWARAQPDFICEATDAELELVAAISRAHPEWVSETRNAADPWLVAHAEVDRRTIVSEENRAGAGVTDPNQKVPNVATERGVATVKFFDFARAEGWSFG